jgi:hypothetical protein
MCARWADPRWKQRTALGESLVVDWNKISTSDCSPRGPDGRSEKAKKKQFDCVSNDFVLKRVLRERERARTQHPSLAMHGRDHQPLSFLRPSRAISSTLRLFARPRRIKTGPWLWPNRTDGMVGKWVFSTLLANPWQQNTFAPRIPALSLLYLSHTVALYGEWVWERNAQRCKNCPTSTFEWLEIFIN